MAAQAGMIAGRADCRVESPRLPNTPYRISDAMTKPKRLPPWHERFQQEDGREWLIRPARPEDTDPLCGAYTLFGPVEVRRHLLRVDGDELPADIAARLCQPDPRMEFVLVAAEAQTPGDALVGAIARAAIIARSRDAEYAILTSRFIEGQGVGRKLLQRVVKWARTKKLDYLYGMVPESNNAMLQLAQSFGFHHDPTGSAPGLLRVVLDLNE
jgi:GNAT superfamily N-acetyltransferase